MKAGSAALANPAGADSQQTLNMKEIKDIIAAFEVAEKRGKKTAIATVVHVEGSSYRRPGARMLITEDGEMTGAISGGCLEGDALRKALLVMIKQEAMVVTYDTNDEDDAKMGLGLGCNGIIQVLIEPVIAADERNPIRLLQLVVTGRQSYCLVTLFCLSNKRAPQPGTCLLYSKEGVVSGGFPALNENLLQAAAEVFDEKQSRFKKYIFGDQDITAFVEWIGMPVSLVIFGGGNDVIPVVQMAAILGWQSTVIDGRAAYAKQERFAGCSVLLSTPENALRNVTVDEHSFFLLMTHNYNYDKAMLISLLNRDARYIGMLGPRKKLNRMIGEMQEEGIVYNPEKFAAVYSPVGLDIGAETPEAIALSILAEIQAVLAGRPSQSLNNYQEPIHSRSQTTILEVKLDH